MIKLYEKFKEKYISDLRGHKENWKKEISDLNELISSIYLEDFSWSFLNAYIVAHGMKLRGAVIDFFVTLIQSKQYCAKDKDIVYECSKNLENFFELKRTNSKDTIWSEYVNPYSVITYESKINLASDKKSRILRYVIVPNANKEVNRFIYSIIDYVHIKYENPGIYTNMIGVLQTIYSNFKNHFSRFDDFDDSSFYEHYHLIYERYTNDKKNGVDHVRDRYVISLIELYVYIQNNLPADKLVDKFSIYSINVLRYQGIRYCLDNGYKVVNYNIYDSFPQESKILINPREMHTRGSGLISKPIMFDASPIHNKKIRNWVLECFWMDTNHILSQRSKLYSTIVDFGSLLSDRYKDDECVIDITIDEVLKFRQRVITRGGSIRTIATKLSIIKYFLKFLEERKYVDIGMILYRVLTYHDDKGKAKKDAYTKEEIELLRKGATYYTSLVNDTDRKLKYKVLDKLFQILFISDIRCTNLLETEVDSLVKSLSCEGNDEYQLSIRAKNGGDKRHKYNITKTVKNLIMEVMELTSGLREMAIGPEKNRIFIFRANSHREISMINIEAVRLYHIDICELMGIQYLGIGAIRNFYMQTAGKIATRRKNYSATIQQLTGHSISVQNRFYESMNILEFCELYYEVEIGDIHVSGKIDNELSFDASHTVMNGCGGCLSDACSLHGLLDCLMCKNFITTTSQIPFFEEEISRIDKAIIGQTIEHEKEFLSAKKGLLVAYLVKLYEKREEE